jgi:hypothetical protein
MSSTQLKLHFIVGFIITVNIHSFLINIHDVQRAITNKKSYEMNENLRYISCHRVGGCWSVNMNRNDGYGTAKQRSYVTINILTCVVVVTCEQDAIKSYGT